MCVCVNLKSFSCPPVTYGAQSFVAISGEVAPDEVASIGGGCARKSKYSGYEGENEPLAGQT